MHTCRRGEAWRRSRVPMSTRCKTKEELFLAIPIPILDDKPKTSNPKLTDAVGRGNPSLFCRCVISKQSHHSLFLLCLAPSISAPAPVLQLSPSHVLVQGSTSTRERERERERKRGITTLCPNHTLPLRVRVEATTFIRTSDSSFSTQERYLSARSERRKQLIANRINTKPRTCMQITQEL